MERNNLHTMSQKMNELIELLKGYSCSLENHMIIQTESVLYDGIRNGLPTDIAYTYHYKMLKAVEAARTIIFHIREVTIPYLNNKNKELIDAINKL